MNVSGSKNKVMSRCSGQRRDVPKSFNFNVVTFGPTSQCYREAYFSTLRHCREVYFQQRDVAEKYVFNVATLKSNIATCLRGIF